MYTNKNNIILIIGVAAAILISSCGNSIKTSSESERVNTYFDKMFDEYLDRHPEYQAYLGIKKDYDQAEKSIESANNIQKYEKRILGNLKTSKDEEEIFRIRKIVENIKRVAEYASDIGEIVLNMNIEKILKKSKV